MKKISYALALAVAALLPIQHAVAQTACPDVTINISTGTDGLGNMLPVGSADIHWLNNQGVGNVVSPFGGWDNLSGSAWLGKNVTAFPAYFTYTRTFSNPIAGTLEFTALADNSVQILLDGTQIAQTAGNPPTEFGFKLANAVSYSGAVPAGTHTLTAIVLNLHLALGFNLKGSVSYTLAPVTLDLSTGMTYGAALPYGAIDPNWWGAKNLVTYTSIWDVFNGSQWIGDNSFKGGAGTFTYNRDFYLPANGTLDLEAMADNNVQLWLDGVLITQTPASSLLGYTLADRCTYTGPVPLGNHRLKAEVYSNRSAYGLNVHGAVTYCGAPVPPDCFASPHYYATSGGGLNVNFFSNHIPLPNMVVSHEWDFGDGNTSTAVNPVHTYASAGNYLVFHKVTVQVLDVDGQPVDECSAEKECKLFVEDKGSGSETGQPLPLDCAGEDSRQARRISAAIDEDMILSPNPAGNQLTVHVTGEAYHLQVIGVDGRVAIQNGVFEGAVNNIDISTLPPGTYVAVIRRGAKTKYIRFIKMQ